MLKLVLIVALLLIAVVAATTKLLSHSTGAETMTPQHAYLRLHHDDELIAKP